MTENQIKPEKFKPNKVVLFYNNNNNNILYQLESNRNKTNQYDQAAEVHQPNQLVGPKLDPSYLGHEAESPHCKHTIVNMHRSHTPTCTATQNWNSVVPQDAILCLLIFRSK